MTDKLSPGELPPETQYKICANVFKKALDSMLTKGFTPEDAVSALLAIRFADLDLDRREYALIEGKTGKRRKIRLNNTALKIIAQRRKEHPEHVHLFQVESNRAKGKPISRNSVSRAFKDAGDRIGLRINTHSMRKSRGYVMFTDDVPIEKVSKVLNHSHPAVTMRYLGITNKEVLDSYDEYEL